MVSITQSTELGTLYRLDEVRAIADAAHARGMRVHVDGARLANAAAALGVSLGELTAGAGVDVVSFGGTKNGLLFGEAVVFCDPELARDFLFTRKQLGQLPSKMRFVAAQFEALLSGDLWLRSATRANQMAARLAEAVGAIDGVEITYPVEANAVFARLERPGDRPAARGAPVGSPVLRLGRGRRRCPVDVRVGHATGRCRRVRRRCAPGVCLKHDPPRA